MCSWITCPAILSRVHTRLFYNAPASNSGPHTHHRRCFVAILSHSGPDLGYNDWTNQSNREYSESALTLVQHGWHASDELPINVHFNSLQADVFHWEYRKEYGSHRSLPGLSHMLILYSYMDMGWTGKGYPVHFVHHGCMRGMSSILMCILNSDCSNKCELTIIFTLMHLSISLWVFLLNLFAAELFELTNTVLAGLHPES